MLSARRPSAGRYTRRMGCLGLASLLLTSACAGTSSETAENPEPSPRVCRAIDTLVKAADDDADLDAFPYVVRDAYATLAAHNPNALLDRRAEQAVKVARAYTSDGARDMPGPRWNDKLELTIPSFVVYFDQAVQAPMRPLVPAPVGEGCPDVTTARLRPGLASMEQEAWTDAPDLSGVFTGSERLTRLLLAQMGDEDREDSMCRRFEKPLGLGDPDNIDFGVHAGVGGFSMFCAFDLRGPREIGLAVASRGGKFAVPEGAERVDSGVGPLRLVRGHRSMAESRDRPIEGDAALGYDPDEGIGIEVTSTGRPGTSQLVSQVEATAEVIRTHAR